MLTIAACNWERLLGGAENAAVQDIVFCFVRETNLFYGHIVSKKKWDYDAGRYKYWISNINGRLNGTCHLDTIYGRLFDVIK